MIPSTAAVAALLSEGVDVEDLVVVRRRLGASADPDAVVAELGRHRRLPVSAAAAPATAAGAGRTDARDDADGPRLVVCGDGMPSRLAATWSQGGPLWLWVHGEVPEGTAVAVVGTRRPTLDGVRLAEALGEGLAAAGVTVVSGLARGIDQAAHRGALRTGRTVAVLGTGHGVDYPRGSAELRQAIAGEGALVSEYPPGRGIRHRTQFLARNRILAGLADAVVVVEAGARSGALNTAGLAGDLGRDVLVVPSSPSNPAASGALALLADGAVPVRHADDVLAVLGPMGTGDSPSSEGTTPDRERSPPVDGRLSAQARAIRALTGPVPASPSALATAAGVTPREALVALSELEDAGLVTRHRDGVVRGPREG